LDLDSPLGRGLRLDGSYVLRMGFQPNVVANINGVIRLFFLTPLLHFSTFFQEDITLGIFIYEFKYRSKTFGQQQDILFFLIFYYFVLMP
jgi:hypothetical protein